MGLLDRVKRNLGLADKGHPGAGRQAGEDTAAVEVSKEDPFATEAAAAEAASQQEAADVAGMQAARQTEADIDGSQEAQEAQEAQEVEQAHEAFPNASGAAEDGPDAKRVTEVVVEPGDTMGGIAAQFGVDLTALIATNADTVPNPDHIYPGQVLRLP
ncbi:LysM peptidoglycan-binding domain-containing protein [Arthrobacter sp. fls2-241-R2A-200]|uniref:LysM peptidoglycan-binding domain-containing protein n=1 Tax=Arthrobacter sp. fls2-241-R2A-200 TaxID=3040281 RepID=UPI00255160D2|nr:LysM peptidoglycan-binding domain-containing protein [Arthrobacter sp. fls2-241-R2A-200]